MLANGLRPARRLRARADVAACAPTRPGRCTASSPTRPALARPPDDLNALDPALWPRRRRRGRPTARSTVRGHDVRDLAAEHGTPGVRPRRGRLRAALPRLPRRRSAARRSSTPARRSSAPRSPGWVDEEGLASTSAPAASSPSRCAPGFPGERIALHGNNKSVGRAGRARSTPASAGSSSTRSTRSTGSPRCAPSAGVRPAGAGPGHRRRRGAHPRVHRDRARGPEVRLLARRRRRRSRRSAGSSTLPALELRRPALAHRLADLRHRRLRGRRAPGGRAAGRRSATSTASSCPSSTSAAASASPTPPTTTRPTSPTIGRVAARDRRARVRRARPGRAARWRSSRAGHRRPGHVSPSTRSARSRTGRRGMPHLRLRRRRDERQHPHRAVRRRLHRARWPRAPRPRRRCWPAWSASTARPATSWCKDAWLPGRPRARRPARRRGHRRLLPVDGQQLQPRAAAAGGRGRRRRGSRVLVRRETVDDLLASTSATAGRGDGRERMGARRLSGMGAQPLRVALLGCGVVGSEVVRLLHAQADDLAARVGAPLELAGIAVRRPAATAATCRSTRRCSPPTRARWSAAADVDIVVEVIGGIEPARTLLLAALRARRQRRHRQQGAARRGRRRAVRRRPTTRGVDLYYEAAVAGAIPLLRPLRESLAGDRVTPGPRHRQRHHQLHPDPDERDRRRASPRRSEAQALGYAEADPTADVEGFDAAAKAAILAGARVPHPGHRRRRAPRGHHRGHRAPTSPARAAMGCVVKLLAIAERVRRTARGVGVRVHPAMIPRTHPLAGGARRVQRGVRRGRGGRPADVLRPRRRAARRPRARCSATSSPSRRNRLSGGRGPGESRLRRPAGPADRRGRHPLPRQPRRRRPARRARRRSPARSPSTTCRSRPCARTGTATTTPRSSSSPTPRPTPRWRRPSTSCATLDVVRAVASVMRVEGERAE